MLTGDAKQVGPDEQTTDGSCGCTNNTQCKHEKHAKNGKLESNLFTERFALLNSHAPFLSCLIDFGLNVLIILH